MLKKGQPVLVLDPGLVMLRQISGEVNHHGWVDSIEGDTVIVLFPIGDDDPHEHGQLAPYPARMVRPRKGEWLEQSQVTQSAE